MATARSKPQMSAHMNPPAWTQCRPALDGGLEGLDSRRGCHYVPMDLFIDTNTVQMHFHVSAIRARRDRVRSALGRRFMV